MTNPNFLYDDIGSYPLPEGVTKPWIKEAFSNVELHKAKLYELLQDALRQKLNAGVEVPTYPQFQNMITQFSEPIMNEDRTEAPLLIKEEEGVITALELASDYAFRTGVDTQIHLHSPIFYETVCQVKGLEVIGVESAVQPSLLALIDKEQLDNYDKFLRIGVARTDILSMAAEYDELHHTNAFKDKGVLNAVVTEYNSP